ncbi:MAG: DEAD/DEAH box helicase, partial [Clostridia bacterium]
MENLFTNFGLDANITKAMQEEGLITPTPIQQEVIPVAMSGKDVVAQAPTGTGKTLGFLLPALAKIDRDDENVQALVLCPTRELVIQTTEVIKNITKYYEKLRSCAVYGGQNIQRQLLVLRKKPQIVIGTPGRVLDHIERRTLKLENVNFFVLDEGDEMFDMGFRNDIDKIMSKISKNSQKLVFSATMPKEIKVLVDEKLNEPQYIQTKFEGGELPKIEQKYAVIKDSQRVAALLYLIDQNGYKRSIVFCNTKHRADKLTDVLATKKRSAMVLHGDLKQSQRTRIMQMFRNGEIEMLVATDVMARGIDVDDVQAIFNFDPPSDADFYVHRIGRTARANKGGIAYTFIGAEQTGSIPSYQKVTNNALEYIEMPELEDNAPMPRDASNRMREVRKNTTRFFVNVGQMDKLDRESVIKLVTGKTSIEAHQITDVKLRENYGFVEVLNGCEQQFLTLQGTVIGKRELRIETATALQSGGKGRISGGSREGSSPRSFDRKPRTNGERAPRSFDRAPREDGENRAPRTYDRKPREDGENRAPRTYDRKPREDGENRAPRTYDRKPREDGENRAPRSYDRKPRED